MKSLSHNPLYPAPATDHHSQACREPMLGRCRTRHFNHPDLRLGSSARVRPRPHCVGSALVSRHPRQLCKSWPGPTTSLQFKFSEFPWRRAARPGFILTAISGLGTSPTSAARARPWVRHAGLRENWTRTEVDDKNSAAKDFGDENGSQMAIGDDQAPIATPPSSCVVPNPMALMADVGGGA